jgi:hypothetical protein
MWRDPRSIHRLITLDHLLRMRSGLAFPVAPQGPRVERFCKERCRSRVSVNLRRPTTTTALPVYLQQRKMFANGEHRRLVPEADISQLSFYDFVGAGEDRWRNGQPERLRSVEVDDKLKPRRLLDRQIGRLGTSEDLSDVNASLPKGSRVARSIAGQAASRGKLRQ